MDPSLASLLRKEIHEASSFQGTLMFKMKDSNTETDILQFCSKSFYRKKEGMEAPTEGQIFDPVKYPPTKEGFQLLKQAIISSARISGQRIKMHKSQIKLKKMCRYHPVPFHIKTFSCCRSQVYKSQKHGNGYAYNDYCDLYPSNVKNTSPHNDRKTNARTNGLQMTRKTETLKPLDMDKTCKFSFDIAAFDYGMKDGFWFIRGGVGNANHVNHLLFTTDQLPHPVNVMSDYEKEKIGNISNSGKTPVSVTMHILNNDAERVYDRNQIMYLHAKAKIQRQLEEDMATNPSVADTTVNFLKSIEGGKMYCLYHQVQSDLHSDTQKGRPKNKSTSHPAKDLNLGYFFEYEDSSGEIVVDHVVFSDNFQTDLDTFGRTHRDSLRIGNTQKMLIACAWVLPHEIYKFSLFPECLFGDVTAGTNKERRPFFHLCGKDNNNKAFTVLRAWLPSECTWVFHWLNHKVLVSFYSSPILNKIRIYVTDGDPQSMSQTDSFIQSYARNCMRVRCAWHIIYKNLLDDKRFPKYKDKDASLVIQRDFLQWLYFGLVAGGAETKDEFNGSMNLLVNWVKSDSVANVVGKNVSQFWLDWMEQHIIPQQQYIAFYNRINIRHFDECSNSVNEGCNFTIKHSSIKVNANSSLDDSTIKITEQSIFNNKLETTKVCRKMLSTPTWSSSNTSSVTTPYAESLLREQYFASTNYSYVQISQNLWYMKRNDPGIQYFKDMPLIKRTRVLKYDENNNILTCSCGYFSRFGLPCRHMILLMGGHEDYHVSFRWWRVNGITFSKEISNNVNDVISSCQQDNPLFEHGILWRRNDILPDEFPQFTNGEYDIDYYTINLPGTPMQCWNYHINEDNNSSLSIDKNPAEVLHEVHEGGTQLSQDSVATHKSSMTTYQELMPFYKLLCDECDNNEKYVQHCKASLMKMKGDIIAMKMESQQKSDNGDDSEFVSCYAERQSKSSCKRLRSKV